MEVMKREKEKVEPLKINVKFWGWFHVAAVVAGFVFLLVANGRMWGQLSERGLYDVMMQVGGLGYLLGWGAAFLNLGKVKLAFSLTSLAFFCMGISLACAIKHVFLS